MNNMNNKYFITTTKPINSDEVYHKSNSNSKVVGCIDACDGDCKGNCKGNCGDNCKCKNDKEDKYANWDNSDHWHSALTAHKLGL